MADIKTFISWAQVQELTEVLFSRIPFQPSAVVAVSRGGLIPGVMLSHMFKCRNFHVIHCQQYGDDHKAQDLQISMGWEAHIALLNADTVVIDDIIDKGTTFAVLDKKFPNPLKAALISKQTTPFLYALRTPTEAWVDFPWELAHG